MDALYFPYIWPEEQLFSPPSSLESTGSPNLPDDVIAILAKESKLKKALKRTSNTIKRYFPPPVAAYPHWSAYTPQHLRPDAIEADQPRTDSGYHSNATSFSETTASDNSSTSLKLRKFTLSEWRLVSEDKGKRVWVNFEGVRVREERLSWWAALRKRAKRSNW
ncbi:hypothetical protein E8E11_001660 [Didymella keratinophila]|nr:hypothetical protein E8E11_001660 [Didymella keratinophila]